MTVEKLTYMLAIAEQLALPPKRRTKLSHVGKLGGLGSVCALFLFCAATTIASPAQVLTTLVNFNYSNGAEPQLMSLIQATDGNLYGTTSLGGPIGSHGTIFKMTAAGVLTTLANLSDADGILPTAGVVQGTDGNFYGTTEESGAHIFGTVFKMTRRGTLTPLYSFCAKKGCRDGGQPDAALIQGKDGNLYGTTQGGGANDQGTVFKITLAGALTTLYSFCSQIDCVDGSQPSAELVQGSDGNFYGTTYNGGSGPSFGGCFNGCGTVFKITSEGKLTTLHNFDGADGNSLLAGLIQATDGNFYGTTEGGGTNGQGTVFKITPGGVLTTLHSFGGADGVFPQAGLVQATDRKLYGTTYFGGANGYGTVFKINLSGTVTTLYSFCAETNCSDGANSSDGLVQATNGKLYGTTVFGGSYHEGTVFRLEAGLRPFVETRPTLGKVGGSVIILGPNLTGASDVTFDGTPATFRVVSKSEIRTTVPIGATTGFVEVTTPKKKLKSNVVFRVTK